MAIDESISQLLLSPSLFELLSAELGFVSEKICSGFIGEIEEFVAANFQCLPIISSKAMQQQIIKGMPKVRPTTSPTNRRLDFNYFF